MLIPKNANWEFTVDSRAGVLGNCRNVFESRSQSWKIDNYRAWGETRFIVIVNEVLQVSDRHLVNLLSAEVLGRVLCNEDWRSQKGDIGAVPENKKVW